MLPRTPGRRTALKVLDSFIQLPSPRGRQAGPDPTPLAAGVLAYFTKARANNGGTEAINVLVELARGFRYCENYRLRMLLIDRGLDGHHRGTPERRRAIKPQEEAPPINLSGMPRDRWADLMAATGRFYWSSVGNFVADNTYATGPPATGTAFRLC